MSAVPVLESHHLIRRRDFPVDRGFDDRGVERALHILNSERFTGKLIINFTGGSVGSIQCEEQARLPPATK